MPVRTVRFEPGGYYHIYNRGSEKRTIFQSNRDYTKFLDRTIENSKKYEVKILCYCLIPNHFHFLLQESSRYAITSFLNAVQLGHAKYFNTKYDRVGPLYQGRFKAKPVETDEYLMYVSAYIHRNPIANFLDSGIPRNSRNRDRNLLLSYPYSSYRSYIGLDTNTFVQTDTVLDYFSKTNPKLSYASFVENYTPEIELLIPNLADI